MLFYGMFSHEFSLVFISIFSYLICKYKLLLSFHFIHKYAHVFLDISSIFKHFHKSIWNNNWDILNCNYKWFLPLIFIIQFWIQLDFSLQKSILKTSDFCPRFSKKHKKKTSIHHCDEARSFLYIIVQKILGEEKN